MFCGWTKSFNPILRACSCPGDQVVVLCPVNSWWHCRPQGVSWRVSRSISALTVSQYSKSSIASFGLTSKITIPYFVTFKSPSTPPFYTSSNPSPHIFHPIPLRFSSYFFKFKKEKHKIKVYMVPVTTPVQLY